MNISEIHVYSRTDSGIGTLQFKIAVGSANVTKSYILKGATGLDPTEIMSQYYGRASGTLTKYFKASMKPRVVTFLLRLNPQYNLNETVAGLRDTIYRSLAPSLASELQLVFVDSANNEIASLYGNVSQLEAGIFNVEPQIQITFTCKKPFLEKSTYTEVTTGFTGTSFSWVDSLSTAPHGYIMQFKFATGGTPFTITNVTPDGNILFYIAYPFIANDILTLNSEDGAKSLSLYRPSAGTINLASYVDPLSIWPISYPGTSQLLFTTGAASGSKISYKPTYWGI